MNTFVGIWIFFVAVFQIKAATAAEVNVTVFYESLCSDSIRFITKQLYPTYKLLQDNMKIEFVPFGKAEITVNPWRITCQHGRNECLGNAVQACALARYPDPKAQVEIVNCLMSDSHPPSAAQRCATKLNFNFNANEIDACSTDEEGRQLLLAQQEKTRRFNERLRFVPTILVNDELRTKEAIYDFKSVVCKKLQPQVPDECKEN